LIYLLVHGAPQREDIEKPHPPEIKVLKLPQILAKAFSNSMGQMIFPFGLT